MAMGQQYLIGGKGNKNGVAVTALYISRGVDRYAETILYRCPEPANPGDQPFYVSAIFIRDDTTGQLLVSGASEVSR